MLQSGSRTRKVEQFEMTKLQLDDLKNGARVAGRACDTERAIWFSLCNLWFICDHLQSFLEDFNRSISSSNNDIFHIQDLTFLRFFLGSQIRRWEVKSFHGLAYVGRIFVSLCVRKFMNSYSESKVSLNIRWTIMWRKCLESQKIPQNPRRRRRQTKPKRTVWRRWVSFYKTCKKT